MEQLIAQIASPEDVVILTRYISAMFALSQPDHAKERAYGYGYHFETSNDLCDVPIAVKAGVCTAPCEPITLCTAACTLWIKITVHKAKCRVADLHCNGAGTFLGKD